MVGSWDTGGVTGEPRPIPRPAKPRLLQDGRDMFWSLAPLVVGCILLAGLVGMCSFQPGGTNRGTVPAYDAAKALQADAATLGFPVRLPVLPAGWISNSGGRGGIADGRTDPTTGHRLHAATSVVGYISPTGMYLSLTQSNADEDKLVGSIHPEMYPTGTVDVLGTSWVVYQGADSKGAVEPVWTTSLTSSAGDTQVAITGAGSDDEFSTLAAATQSQAPLPVSD
ncbi:hypothetical protein MB901379_03822 [Mycobacterium basiliense]|uniref:DUF4245 domain-containing protein n=1 Tax=Mycobacterium basiliense TaxID=2094119 RepID=A0A3S4DVK4_9MYCO|nr:DUF4245 domain-containing protein [Mycobacterium basiliense]VDM90226.1 hypothetical protein MB901379_03822 [Mycobacterium basiliense]